jgi:hypothetical protein
MFLVFIVFRVWAGHPRVFSGKSFLEVSDKAKPDSLQERVFDMKKVVTGIESVKDELQDWTENFYRFRIRVEKKVLLEIFTEQGVREFYKELKKCGFSQDLKDEDLKLCQSVCSEENKIQALVEDLIKKVTDNANVCINVKEKYRARIQESYDEYFYTDEIKDAMNQVKVDPSPALIQLESFTQRMKAIYLENREKVENICKDFELLKEKVLAIRESTFEQLGVIFV